jgi:hypothetical protein
MRATIVTCLQLLLVLGWSSSTCHAWTTGSVVSSFGGSVLMLEQRQQQYNNNHCTTIEMKKGKDNVPPAMRSQYAKQKELVAMRDQMVASSKPGADGLPVFNLFVRTKRANVR